MSKYLTMVTAKDHTKATMEINEDQLAFLSVLRAVELIIDFEVKLWEP